MAAADTAAIGNVSAIGPMATEWAMAECSPVTSV